MIETLTPLAQMDERVKRAQGPTGSRGRRSRRRVGKRLWRNASRRDEADLDARLQLAHVYVSRQDYRPALEQLLAIVERDRKWGDDIGRKTMLKVFELMGNQGELVSEFRRRLARTHELAAAIGERGLRRCGPRNATFLQPVCRHPRVPGLVFQTVEICKGL